MLSNFSDALECFAVFVSFKNTSSMSGPPITGVSSSGRVSAALQLFLDVRQCSFSSRAIHGGMSISESVLPKIFEMWKCYCMLWNEKSWRINISICLLMPFMLLWFPDTFWFVYSFYVLVTLQYIFIGEYMIHARSTSACKWQNPSCRKKTPRLSQTLSLILQLLSGAISKYGHMRRRYIVYGTFTKFRIMANVPTRLKFLQRWWISFKLRWKGKRKLPIWAWQILQRARRLFWIRKTMWCLLSLSRGSCQRCKMTKWNRVWI